MKTKEALKELGITKQRLHQLVKDGYIKKLGRDNYCRDSVEDRKINAPIEGRNIAKTADLSMISDEDREEFNKFALSSLRNNLLDGDASITKFYLQHTDEEYMTDEQRLSRQVIHHTPEW